MNKVYNAILSRDYWRIMGENPILIPVSKNEFYEVDKIHGDRYHWTYEERYSSFVIDKIQHPWDVQPRKCRRYA
jgi:hypothetical protein